MATLSSDDSLSPNELVDMARAAPSMDGLDLAKEVTCAQPHIWEEGINPAWNAVPDYQLPITPYHVVAYDFGIKHNLKFGHRGGNQPVKEMLPPWQGRVRGG